MINILFFAKYREELGVSELQLDEVKLDTVTQVMEHLSLKGGVWQRIFGDNNILVAVNQEIAKLGSSLKDGDEVAFFPPVTGG